jgi:predicted transcriptional regulator
MVSRQEIERLRLEADTILTRLQSIRDALEQERSESDDWEGTVELTLETPQGDAIDVTLPLDGDPARAAQKRYERAKKLEPRLERRQQVDDQLTPMPADPLASLVCYHLDAVEGNYPKSMAGHLDAERGAVESLCKQLESAGLLERVESGTVKQRRVKAKQADEVRQHHTYYRLSRAGDHLLRFLSTEEGAQNVLWHLPDGRTLVERLVEDGPNSPRETASDSEEAFETIRHRYRALARVGLLRKTRVSDSEGSDTAGDDATHTYYEPTETAVRLLETQS